jgi:hypothetical protein
MAGSKPAGTLGLSAIISIDPGTLCRNASHAPSVLGTPALQLDDEFTDPSLSYRLTIREALRRGATTLHVSLLRMYLDAAMACATTSSSDLDESMRSLRDLGNSLIVQQEEEIFAKTIKAEFESLPAGFVGGKWSPVKDEYDYRHHIRPVYYAYGYTEPTELLNKMTRLSVLGKSEIWIHEAYANILRKLPFVLDGWRPGLAVSLGKQVKSLLGLQIRPIAGSSTLSNHALGCAIDIDAYSNPRIYGPLVIEVFNRAARSEGVTFDFGKAVLPEKERRNDDYTEDDVVEIYNRGIPASNAVRSWLRRHLPKYKRLMTQIESAEKLLKTKHSPGTPLLKRLGADEASARQAGAKEVANALRAEAKAARANPVGGVCEPPSIVAEKAIEDIRSAANEILCNLDLSGIQLLYENYEPKYIETWEKEGVLNIPLALAAALVGPLKLKWGQQYKDSKDAMHFELIKPGSKRHEPYVAPNSPLARGEKARTLSKLMDQHYMLATTNWFSRKEPNKKGSKRSR